jgi:hypothetical protein
MFIILYTIWKLSYIYGVPIHCIYQKIRKCNNGYFPLIFKIEKILIRITRMSPSPPLVFWRSYGVSKIQYT